MGDALAAIPLGNVDAVERGQRIRQRKERAGVSNQYLASVAGVDRGRIPKIEAGDPVVRSTTFAAVERALDEIERKLQIEDDGEQEPEDHSNWVRATVTGNFNVKAVYEGPPEVVGPLVERLFALAHEGQGAPPEGATIDPSVYDPIRRAVKKRRARKAAGTDQSHDGETGNQST